MLSRLLAHEHGRLALLALMLGFSLYIAAAGSATRLDFWRLAGVPPMVPTFADARVITSGWECTRLGIDVLEANPCDAFHRQMNYPRIWTVPALVADVGQEWTGRLAAVFAASFFLGLLVIVGRIGFRSVAVYAIALASPSVMLALERGNSDLLIFAFVAAAAVLSASGRAVGSAIALLAAVVLKLYPVAAVGALRDWRARAVVIAATVAYVAVTWADIERILAHTSRQTGWSYGLLNASTVLLPGVPQPGAMIALGALGLVAAILVARGRPMPAVGAVAETAFVAGASIYVATYVLGPSWDYRLVFLLLTLPALLEAASRGRLVMLALVVASLWLSRTETAPAFWVDQLVKTAVAIGFLAALLQPFTNLRGLRDWRQGHGSEAIEPVTDGAKQPASTAQSGGQGLGQGLPRILLERCRSPGPQVPSPPSPSRSSSPPTSSAGRSTTPSAACRVGRGSPDSDRARRRGRSWNVISVRVWSSTRPSSTWWPTPTARPSSNRRSSR
jgi:hypothetical protein